MKKPQINYAFIDGNNLHLTMRYLGWDLDYKRFRVYLSEHYGVSKAYYFIGYVPENTGLYNFLQDVGYQLVFKPILKTPEGKIKGNCDAELVLQAMIDLDKYEKAIIVSSDGDYYCLVNYLLGINKLERVLAPCEKGCSHLLIEASKGEIAYMDNLKQKLDYIKKRTL
ncbi:MAG TPA: NYN domain-containing protein [Dehalococcoidales bacterium]|nr:NYN domain-containing protein [Dehalococcoidales bacterium]